MSGPVFELRARLATPDFTLDVDATSAARTLGVFGRSGSGKSTLLDLIAGWRRPDAGTLRVGGTTLFDAERRIDVPIERRRLGYVAQDPPVFPHWGVEQNVLAGRSARGATGEDAALLRAVMATLGLEPLLKRPSTGLSGGERRRVALARALMSRPAALLLDEPLGALDEGLRRRLIPEILRIREAFATPLVFVSHDPTEVQALCDEAIVLDDGRVVAQGPPDRVLRDLRDPARPYANVLKGVVDALVEGTAAARLDAGGSVRIPARGLAVGDRVVFAVGAEEILVALDRPTRISARNVLDVVVERVEGTGPGAVRVDGRLEGGAGARLAADLTAASARELGLAPGVAASFVFKTSSCRLLAPLPDRA